MDISTGIGGGTKMKRPKYYSSFAKEINAFLDYRESSGMDISADARYQKLLDNFFIENNLNDGKVTREMADLWRMKQDRESEHHHYMRVNHTKRMLEYLFAKGFPVATIRNVTPPKSNFIPHIYTDDEIKHYFLVVDSYGETYPGNIKNRVQLSVLFRLLYCCGCRITESLILRVKDVDLLEGLLRLKVTKGNKERIVVMSPSLLALMQRYADITFYMLTENDFIFTNRYGQALRRDWVEDLHERLLVMANIPALSENGYRKRLHDWRHTFAVHAFKQMIDSGMDMYVSLPLLSAYLGHSSIAATENYVRLATVLYPYLQERFDAVLNNMLRKEVDDEN